MSKIKFKISLNRCKNHGYYDSKSSFLDLEQRLQSICQYPINLAELRSAENIEQYRDHIHVSKDYEKTSIAVSLDLPIEIIRNYSLPDSKEGKASFQTEHIFKTVSPITQPSLSSDISLILDQPIDSTEKETLIKKRIGQVKFRSQVLELWNNCCAVTASSTVDAIRASHIKPWRHSSDEERVDPFK